MMRLRVLKQIALTTWREFIRTPEAVFWTYGFPVIMAMVLGLAFGSENKAPVPVVVVKPASAAASAQSLPQPLTAVLGQNKRLMVTELPRAAAEQGFRRGKFVVMLEGAVDDPKMLIDPTRPDAELARMHVESTLLSRGHDGEAVVRTEITEILGSRYIDFLIPGLIGLNLLGAGMWGVGFNVVRMRDRKMLRRLIVTPMRRVEFLFAFILSRLVLVIPDAVLIILFGVLVFGVPVLGPVGVILLLVLLGGFCFMGLGLLVAARTKTIEGVSGVMNLVMVPMWLLGGSFFSSERFPDAMQWLIQALPITHVNDALRVVMLEGGGLAEVWSQLVFLLVFGVACLFSAVKLFRWS
ncbi:MAG: ABC transporter permease [Planctomycetota bacterium]|jgi:ABC transporter DrrB family efflux protein